MVHKIMYYQNFITCNLKTTKSFAHVPQAVRVAGTLPNIFELVGSVSTDFGFERQIYILVKFLTGEKNLLIIYNETNFW
jgi:hypothetical protein